MINSLQLEWHIFIVNFRWSKYTKYIDGWLPKFAFFVPLIGYILLFNDHVSKEISFQELIGENSTEFQISSINRLRFIYFGFIFLGISSLIYKIRKPKIFFYGDNLHSFQKNGMEVFSYVDYMNFYGSITSNDRKNTVHRNYPKNIWENFKNNVTVTSISSFENGLVKLGWEENKGVYGSMLLSILEDYFFLKDTKNRLSLTFCLILSTVGYLMLLIPSFDIFITIIKSTFFR